MPIRWRLREVLDEKGITPLELAHMLGVKHPMTYRMAKQTHITRITTGLLERLCNALDCEPGDLLERETPKAKPIRKR